jgi:transposase
MASYSLDLRERVVKAHIEEGQNKSAVARRFGVSRWTVDRYVKRSAAGSLAATPHPGVKQRLSGAQCEVLREQVKAHKDWTLEQHAEALVEATGVKLKKSSVGNYLKRLGITHKKRASSLANAMKGGERGT